MRRPLFNRVTIVGLGLIGGSVGMALKRRGLARQIYGVARRSAALRQAKARRAVDTGGLRLADGLKGAELVLIATPPQAVEEVARQVARFFSGDRLLLTDVASTKGRIVSSLDRLLPPRIRFVGSHPMAGSERSGLPAADPELFDGAVCVVTRTPRTDAGALSEVCALWRSLGSRIQILDPASHDSWAAQVSHLPHLTAAGLVLTADRKALGLAAGGFADSTRVALSDPELWSQIFSTNRPAVLKALNRFLQRMDRLRRAIAQGKIRSLHRQLLLARSQRRRIPSQRSRR